MSPHDSATIEALVASFNDTENIKSGSPPSHWNVASLRCVSSFSGVNPARFADASKSANDVLFATRTKYLICLATCEARSINAGRVSIATGEDASTGEDTSPSPIAAVVLRCNRTTLSSTATTDGVRLVLRIINSALATRTLNLNTPKGRLFQNCRNFKIGLVRATSRLRYFITASPRNGLVAQPATLVTAPMIQRRGRAASEAETSKYRASGFDISC